MRELGVEATILISRADAPQKVFIEAIKLLNQKNDIPSFQAIILGGDQGRNVYKKQLVGLVQQHRLNNKRQTARKSFK